VQHLEQVDDQPDGVVEVQTIRTTDGSVRHVVYLPGTDDLTTTPWSQDADVRDLGTNLLLVSGQDNAYPQGILDAMHQAGVRAGEPVALVGHSQGGMEAAAILAHGSPYAVTHVVTAGSPTAHLDGFPPGSHVLSLENRGDVVPLLDGEDNPDSAEQVTVRFDDHWSERDRQPRPRAVRPRRARRPGQRRPLRRRPARQPGGGRFRRVRGMGRRSPARSSRSPGCRDRPARAGRVWSRPLGGTVVRDP
jgi:hypothetical protein